MQLEGIHHITAITADAQRNLDFYTGAMGLRFVKQTVNHDAPDIYHLYYADETGHPGSVLTFFEFRGAPRGRTGAGMVHTILWRVSGAKALDFWEQRLEDAGSPVQRKEGSLAAADPEGLRFEIIDVDVPDIPLIAGTDDIPTDVALQGFHGARAYTVDPQSSVELLQALNFARQAEGFTTEPSQYEPLPDGTDSQTSFIVPGHTRHAHWIYDPAPDRPGITAAGTVHHIAWASQNDDHTEWRETAVAAGRPTTDVIDRIYFRSIYFREPSGVLFEIATLGPGLTADEPEQELGKKLVLPPWFESRRGELEELLTPLKVR